MEIVYTKHAQKRMNGRGIMEEDVERIIAKGMKWFVKTEGVAGLWHAKMGNIEVVFENDATCNYVVTVYWGE